MLVPAIFMVVLASTALGSVSSSLSEECVAQIQTACPPSTASCAAAICKICTSLGILPSIEPCCAAPTPNACFAGNYVDGVTSTAAHPVTSSAESLPSVLATLSGASGLITDSSQLASKLRDLETSCESFNSIYTSCDQNTPSFRHLAFSDMQSCVCSTHGTNRGSLYDDYYSGCLEYASIVAPSVYSVLGPSRGEVAASHGHSAYLGSRPCEQYQQFTATRTDTPATSSSVAASSTNGLSPLSSSSGVGGGHLEVGKEVSQQLLKLVANEARLSDAQVKVFVLAIVIHVIVVAR
jgi:hypothetical protein